MIQRSGMTLLELVVALTITGVAVGGGYSVFALLSDRQMAASTEADEVARSYQVRATLADWLSNARLTVEDDDVVFRGLDGVRRAPPSPDSPNDELTFFTSARTPVGNSGTSIRLFVESADSAANGLIAELSSRYGNESMRIMLDSVVGGMNVTYTSTVSGISDWSSSWVSNTVLPSGVRITLSPQPGRSLAPMATISLTVSLENDR